MLRYRQRTICNGIYFEQYAQTVPRVPYLILLEIENTQAPPKVEYSITAFGKTLKPVLLALKNWAEKNMLPRMAEKDIPPETRKVAARKIKEIAH